MIGSIVRSNVNGMGWGLAITWPLFANHAWWLLVVWLGSIAIIYGLYQLIKGYTPTVVVHTEIVHCGGRCCVVHLDRVVART